MPAKRLRVLQTFTRDPDEIVVRTTRDAIAGLKENKYFLNPPADPATLEANHNIRADCDCLLHKCRCSRLEWCSCIDDRIACANHTAKRIVKISAGYVRFKTRKRQLVLRQNRRRDANYVTSWVIFKFCPRSSF